MEKIEAYYLIDAAGELKKLVKGAYICKITDVINVPEKEYLDIYFDIVDGEYKGYFTNLEKAIGKKLGRQPRSYTDKALAFFKLFMKRIEDSNPGYEWNWDEKSLIGKFIVVVFNEEEYYNDNNELKTSVKPYEFRSLKALRENRITLPETVKAQPKEQQSDVFDTNPPVSNQTSTNLNIEDDDLPF